MGRKVDDKKFNIIKEIINFHKVNLKINPVPSDPIWKICSSDLEKKTNQNFKQMPLCQGHKWCI